MQDFQTYDNLLADVPSVSNYFSPSPQPTYPDFDTFKIKRKSDGQIDSETDNDLTAPAIDANRVDKMRRAMLIRRRRRRRFRPATIHLSDRLSASA